jgi:hypothetical protein
MVRSAATATFARSASTFGADFFSAAKSASRDISYVLAVPSREGIEVAREKVRDLLGWEKVREMLRERNDIDTASQTRLEGNIRVSRGEMVSQIVMAFSVAVTVNENNDVAAYRISVDGEPLFTKIAADKRLRIESSAVNAEALLPGGPYDLWSTGEKARYVKDLVGAFAATARLPKMLNRAAILETLLQGCIGGDFVLRVTRSDKSVRTFWKSRPDDATFAESSLEVVLSDAAELVEIENSLLAPSGLVGLWSGPSITLSTITAYFSGKHFVEVDKGGYSENQLVPAAGDATIREAVSLAVRAGRVWLVNGTLSVLGEGVPPGFVNETATLLPPPPPMSPADLLPEQLPSAWSSSEATAHHIHAALSAKAGRPLPWALVRQALVDALRHGLVELRLESGPWPCDLGGAAAVKFRARKSEVQTPPPPSFGARTATAELETHEVQDLAERIDDLRKATAGHQLRIKVTVEVGEAGKVSDDVITEVNALLQSVRSGWQVR